MSDAPAIPPALPLTVTLEARQWRTLLELLAEGHHQLRVVGPLYGAIERQCNEQIAIFMQQRSNGAMHEEQDDA